MLKLMFGTSTLRDPAKAGLIDHWRARLATRPRRVLHAVKAVVQRTDVSAELANIRCPTLIVVGAEDRLTSPTHAAFMAKTIANATLLEIPAVGHSANRSEEHTSELQSLMRRSYAVFCLKKKHN